MKNFYSIKEAADIIQVSTQTLRVWDKKGILIPARVLESGYRYYSKEQINKFLNKKYKKNIIYCRANTSEELDKLLVLIDKYLLEIKDDKEYSILTDIDSICNVNRLNFLKIIDDILDEKVEKLILINKNNILSNGYELFEYIANKKECQIEIIDNSYETDKKEILNNIVSTLSLIDLIVK